MSIHSTCSSATFIPFEPALYGVQYKFETSAIIHARGMADLSRALRWTGCLGTVHCHTLTIHIDMILLGINSLSPRICYLS